MESTPSSETVRRSVGNSGLAFQPVCRRVTRNLLSRDCEIQIATVSPHTVRLTILHSLARLIWRPFLSTLERGTILPLGPVKQYTGQEVDQPLSLTLYPGADTSFLLYQDDGRSFNYRKGEWMGILLGWSDSRRELTLSLAPGSRLLPSWRKDVEVRLLQKKRQLVFDGTPLKVKL